MISFLNLRLTLSPTTLAFKHSSSVQAPAVTGTQRDSSHDPDTPLKTCCMQLLYFSPLRLHPLWLHRGEDLGDPLGRSFGALQCDVESAIMLGGDEVATSLVERFGTINSCLVV